MQNLTKEQKYDLVKQDYTGIARWYTDTFDATKELREQLQDFVTQLPKDAKVLDIGSGAGKEAAFIARNANVTAVDVSPEMLALLCTKYPEIETKEADMRMLPFEPETFDAIWSCRAIIHITKDDLKNVLEGFSTVLKKSGVLGLVFISPNDDSEHKEEFLPEEPPNEHLTNYRNLFSTTLITQKLLEAGFTVQKTEEVMRFNERHVYIRAVKQE